MMRDYAGFEEMHLADDWLTLKETSGKVMVLLHDCDITDDYIAQCERMHIHIVLTDTLLNY